MYTVKYADIEQ